MSCALPDYVELTTTRQATLQFEPIAAALSNIQAIVRAPPQPLPPRVTAYDRNAHRAFVQTLGSDAIWRGYFESAPNEADACAA
jgi:DNA polymerase III subunit epsilon